MGKGKKNKPKYRVPLTKHLQHYRDYQQGKKDAQDEARDNPAVPRQVSIICLTCSNIYSL